MRSATRSSFALAGVAAFAIACSSAGGAASSTPSSAAAPADEGVEDAAPPAATTVPPQEVTAPPATPKPTTDAQGDEHIVGGITSAVLSTPYTRTKVDRTDGVTEEIRGGVVTFTFDMNDARVTGKATFTFGVDLYTVVGAEWATLRLTTADGAWEGPCSGGSWNEGDGLIMSCWLTGAGAQAGYTTYLAFTGPANGDADGNGIVEGVIYPGVPPKP